MLVRPNKPVKHYAHCTVNFIFFPNFLYDDDDDDDNYDYISYDILLYIGGEEFEWSNDFCEITPCLVEQCPVGALNVLYNANNSFLTSITLSPHIVWRHRVGKSPMMHHCLKLQSEIKIKTNNLLLIIIKCVGNIR